MHSMTAIVILGLALAATAVAQAVIFFLILRSERKFTKDLLNRLASRNVIEYAQATRILEAQREEIKENPDEGGPIPIFS